VKRFFLGVVIALSLVRFAHAGGSDNPFPLDYPLNFPWSAIEGIWQIVDTNIDSTFSFEVQSDCQGRQILKVYQIDTESGVVIAEGTGYKPDNSFEVYAAMKGRGIENYVLHIGAYKDKTSNPERRMVILRVFSFNTPNSEEDYEIARLPGSSPIKDDVSSGSDLPCSRR
jgi:hypothetical protein